jgi:uroporphyrin-III C-methyltransferase
MGGKEAIKTAQRLLEHHAPLKTPVIVIENCSRVNQKIFRMTLQELAQGLNDLHGPVLLMVGEAMRIRPNQKTPSTLS